MPDLRIIVHAGPGKTGTSAIQYWLNSHRKVLAADYGVMYPSHQTDKNGVSDGNRDSIMSIDGDGNYYVDEIKVSRLLKNFSASSCHTLVLSSERFFRHVDAIMKALPDAEVVLYIRNPIDVFESNYNQSVKRHGQFKPIDQDKPVRFGVLKQLTRLFHTIPKEQFELRPYDRRSYVGGNLINDFLSAIGLPAIAEDKGVNSSYSFEALEFKRWVNYFASDSLLTPLDLFCQSISSGAARYSLIDEASYNQASSRLRDELKAFIDAYDQPHLKVIAECLAVIENREFYRQDADVVNFDAIIERLKVHSRGLFETLHAELMASPLKSYLPASFCEALLGCDADPEAHFRLSQELSERLAVNRYDEEAHRAAIFNTNKEPSEVSLLERLKRILRPVVHAVKRYID